jgi:multidrug resistance protein, MATE family
VDVDPARALDVEPPRPRVSLAKEVATLAWPAIVRGLLMTVVFLVDRLMLGRYDPEALASMQVSGPLLWSVFMIFTAFSAGTIAVVGRSVGAGDADRAQRTIRGVLAFALLVGAVVAVAGFASRGLIGEALAGTAEANATVRAHAGTYLAIVFPFTPLYFFGMLGFTVLQASGDTRTPLYVSAVCHTVNVGMNWVFIFGHLGMPELGIAGAALGTLSAFALEALIVAAVLLRRKHMARLVIRSPDAGDAKALRDVMRVSGPAFAERVLFHVGFLVFAGLIGRLGDTAMAANQALIAIESIGFITSTGFGIAAGALVSQKLGARDPDRAAACGWMATAMAVGALLLVAAFFVALPRQLIGLFSTQEEIILLGARCLLIAAAAQPFMAATDVLAGALRGAGDTRNPMIVAIVGPVFVRVLATWILAFPLGLGLVGVWIGSTLDWIVRSIWLFVVFRRGRWRTLEV